MNTESNYKLEDYAQYLIGQPTKRMNNTKTGVIIGLRHDLDSFIVKWDDSYTGYCPIHFTLPLLITYEQLTTEKIDELQFTGHHLHDLGQVIAKAMHPIFLKWTSDQMDLLDKWGVDRHDLIGKGLAEKRELIDPSELPNS